MMGERTVAQDALFYSFSLERHVPADHLLRSIDRFVDLSGIREELKPFYSDTGRPSIDPELMIRMPIIGYCLGIRSERRLCDEVHLNLAYRWFCRLGLDGDVPDHSTFSKNRHGRFRDSDLLRRLFETTVARCMAEGLVGGEGFAVDASLIRADANRQTGGPGSDGVPPDAGRRAVREYLAVLDDAAFGAATPVVPKYLAPADPASRWTSAHRGPAFYAYSTNYLIDLDHAVIMDVEASTAVRQAEVTACKRMIARVSRAVDNTLDRQFDVAAPDRAWVRDITYIRTLEGFAYLAVMIDLYSRRVVGGAAKGSGDAEHRWKGCEGWSMQSRQTTDVVLQALHMAVWRRKPKQRVLIHSDQGSQFTSMEWAGFIRAHNFEHSMSRRGNCHDNAVADSFFSLLKRERIRRRTYKTREEARQDVFDYVEMFYNPVRKQVRNGMLLPVAFERQQVLKAEGV